jgi:hypothetical protein
VSAFDAGYSPGFGAGTLPPPPPRPLVVMPDVVRLVTTFLRAQPEIAALVEDRVYSIIPAARTYPLLVCNQVADVPLGDSWPGLWWAVAADLRLSGYADTSNDARALVELARAAMKLRLPGDHPEGVVVDVRPFNLHYLPDEAVLSAGGRPIPRWTTSVTVTIHPNP